ncbi:alternate signal-mediated exported protein, RER_14450 family [Arthrobacter alpinus]|uniref:Alternate signal-mediated exported protein, RER_14450 family n=1 Tax=Arthrobacter alpinus TaxID=656366 RepID=A0A1H5PFN9_9MICC|nr:alternate-type signal peptide domain-containing protein [Arthrobacter alpinus]SEF12645.1 alternate signal-mediated exported protein, RER_14450 family [Arthrobacter alpinus]
MSPAATRVAARATGRRRQFIVGASTVAVSALLIGGATWALWQAQTGFSGGHVTAGDLNLERGTGTWHQITPGVTAPAYGSLDTASEPFVSMPGDVIEFVVPITTTLQGENLNAALLVDVGSAASQELSSGLITASYRVENAQGEQLAPATGGAELGEPVTLPGLIGSNEGVSTDWTVVVTVNVHGDYRWTEQEPLLDLGSWTVDGIKVGLDQVRGGEASASARRGS